MRNGIVYKFIVNKSFKLHQLRLLVSIISLRFYCEKLFGVQSSKYNIEIIVNRSECTRNKWNAETEKLNERKETIFFACMRLRVRFVVVRAMVTMYCLVVSVCTSALFGVHTLCCPIEVEHLFIGSMSRKKKTLYTLQLIPVESRFECNSFSHSLLCCDLKCMASQSTHSRWLRRFLTYVSFRNRISACTSSLQRLFDMHVQESVDLGKA